MPYQPTMLATQAGYDILEDGGNAVDAGVAASIALAVVQSDIVNIGGVCAIVHDREAGQLAGGADPRRQARGMAMERHGDGAAWRKRLRRNGSIQRG